jgi:hypothetical protein
MKITKANGETAEFNPEKIIETLRRIGAKDDLIHHVVSKVKVQIKDGMTTKEVYAVVRKELHRENRCIAHRYNLRRGLLRLGPAGFKFEKYVASILKAYRYDAELPTDDLAGLCVRHEVDVVAKMPGRTIMIEAKFRNRFEDSVTLKDTLATWARFVDLQEGAKAGKKTPNFDEAWIVTNGKFSDRSMQFGTCKGMQLIGWGTSDQSLPRMVDHAALYPITVLEKVHQWELEKFAAKDLMLCSEIATGKPKTIADRTGIPIERINSIIDTCKEVMQG